MKIAVIYGGQGSQEVGMGKTLYESSELFKAHLDDANRLLDYDLLDLMFNREAIHETKYAQVAIYAFNDALTVLLKNHGIKFDASAGLSLGEYNALLNAGVFTFEEGLNIIKHRGLFMQKCSESHLTKMLALLGSLENVNACINAYDDVYIANYNNLTQYVVGGSETSILKVMETAKDFGIKRAVLLETSGAFHTPFMQEAEDEFKQFLEPLALHEPQGEVYLNVSGRKYQEAIQSTMISQITSPVKFYDMIMNMESDGIDCFIEIGPKPILKSMIKKLVSTKHIYHVSDLESLNETINSLKELSYEI